ncbi:MAG: response regulator transcription factor [Gemmatimonadaceae bacterium]|nr:response regulator transcription factor [Chitinophagaceae bacterium]
METKIKIAIVDDHQIVIDGLKSLLEGHDRFVIVADVNRPKELLQILEHTEVDLLLTDVMMPELNGRELARMVKKRFPKIRILALSMNGEGAIVREMMDDSAIAGYVLKNIGKQELLLALEKISGGGKYFSAEVLDSLEKEGIRKKDNEDRGLTDRELEIIRLIEKEFSNKSIADSLFISERTVETHRKNIFRKTRTSSVVGLVKYAYEHKLI